MATYRVQQQRWTHWPKVLIVEQYTTLENYKIGVAYGRYVPEQRVTELEIENARLRKLLRAAYNCTNAGPSCLECRMVAGGCTLLSAMRELGVEVDL